MKQRVFSRLASAFMAAAFTLSPFPSSEIPSNTAHAAQTSGFVHSKIPDIKVDYIEENTVLKICAYTNQSKTYTQYIFYHSEKGMVTQEVDGSHGSRDMITKRGIRLNVFGWEPKKESRVGELKKSVGEDGLYEYSIVVKGDNDSLLRIRSGSYGTRITNFDPTQNQGRKYSVFRKYSVPKRPEMEP